MESITQKKIGTLVNNLFLEQDKDIYMVFVKRRNKKKSIRIIKGEDLTRAINALKILL